MSEREMVRIYVSALKRFKKPGRDFDMELLRECVILSLGAYSRLYKQDIDKMIFDESDPNQRALGKVTQDLFHEGFIIKKRDGRVYYYLTNKGQRHYAKFLHNIKMEMYDNPVGHNDF